MDAAEGPRRLYLFRALEASPPGGVEMVAGSYLVTMAGGRQVLVDTGPPRELPGLDAPVTSVLDQLSALGLGPDDIGIVVSTHLDFDHAGWHDAFPNAEHVIQREHLEVARGGHQRFAGGREHWGAPGLHFRAVEGDTDLLPGFRLIATPGHVQGHQSVLLRLPNTGPVLLTVDAVSMQRDFSAERVASPMDENEEQLRESTRKLLEIVDREGVTMTIHHHDAAQWRSLKVAPEFYD
ncbi:MAG: N-acyl homoserine lactonase family protein, partial [Candidatus Dormiibacterota bacterium]